MDKTVPTLLKTSNPRKPTISQRLTRLQLSQISQPRHLLLPPIQALPNQHRR
jgi:hypothetical protein